MKSYFRMPWIGIALSFLLLTTFGADSAPRFKVVVLSFPDDNHINTDTAGSRCIERLAEKDSFSADIWTSMSNVNSTNLEIYDLMMWVMATPLEWDSDQMIVFENWINAGKPWIGFHVAGLVGSDYGMNWPWFESPFFGTTFKSHPPERQYGTVHTDPGATAHPIMQNVASEFAIYDEWWAFNTNPRDLANVEILATVDEASYDPATSTMPGGDHPVAWTFTGFGRNVYFSMGHPASAFTDANFETMIENAILWAVDLQTANKSPAPARGMRNGSESLSILRNPGTMTIAQPNNAPMSVTMHNARGAVVARANTTTGTCTIDISAIRNGVVFLCVQTEKKRVIREVTVF